MYHISLFIHILAGTVSLLAGLLAIIARKGKSRHILSGKFFYIAMYHVGFSGIVLSYVKSSTFLFCIGILTLYLAYSGKKSIDYWKKERVFKLKFIEKIPVLLAFLTAVVMICYPVHKMIRYNIIFIPLPLIFGVIMLAGTIHDFIIFSKPDNFTARNNNWLFRHIVMMGAAYISALTAFLVVNIQMKLFWIPWLLPSVIGTFLISRTVNKWKHKVKDIHKPSIRPL